MTWWCVSLPPHSSRFSRFKPELGLLSGWTFYLKFSMITSVEYSVTSVIVVYQSDVGGYRGYRRIWCAKRHHRKPFTFSAEIADNHLVALLSAEAQRMQKHMRKFYTVHTVYRLAHGYIRNSLR